MKAKLIILAMLIFTYSSYCQTLHIHKTDSTITSIDLDEIDRITFTLDSTSTFNDSRDDTDYHYIIIGTQTWMAENLRFLPSVSDPDDGSPDDPYYYVHDYYGTDVEAAKATNNFTKYGVLYNWQAALTACPGGWHLPTDEEWTTLSNFLINNGFGYDGSGDEIGKSMASTSGWFSSLTAGQVGNDQGSNNSSGFNALPAGHRGSNDSFYKLGEIAYFFSSTPNGSSYAETRQLEYNYDILNRIRHFREKGLSVRCVRD